MVRSWANTMDGVDKRMQEKATAGWRAGGGKRASGRRTSSGLHDGIPSPGGTMGREGNVPRMCSSESSLLVGKAS
jgi:hypothetical protein